MLTKAIGEQYFGIRLSFQNPPVSGCPITDFYYRAEELMPMLSAFFWQYEVLTPELKYREDITVPIKLTSIHDWQDLALLLKQAEGDERRGVADKPGIIVDIGGRKITVKVPSDRFFADLGEMPDYQAETGADFSSITITVSTKSPDEQKKAMDVNVKSDNPIDGRLGYKKIFNLMSAHYGQAIDDGAIAKEVRLLLNGHKLTIGHSTVLPVLAAALYAAEVSRNRNCFVTGLMLLDLIQFRATTRPGNIVYNWKNALWHPSLYTTTREQDKQPQNIELAKVGGLHPMTHMGSFSDEFTHSPYQSDLKWANKKSVIILIDWLSHYAPFRETFGATIMPLNESQFMTAINQVANKDFKTNSAAHQLVFAHAVGSCIAERSKHLDLMLPRTVPTIISANLAAPVQQGNFLSQMSITTLERRPFYRIGKLTDQSSQLPILEVIKIIDPDFKENDLAFCLENVRLVPSELFKLVKELTNCNELIDFPNYIFSLQKDFPQQQFIYRLILSSKVLFDTLSQFSRSRFAFIASMGCCHGIKLAPKDFNDSLVIKALTGAANAYVFNSLSVTDHIDLCRDSCTYFSWLLLEKATIAKQVLGNIPGYQLSEMLLSIKNSLTGAQKAKIVENGYTQDPVLGRSFSMLGHDERFQMLSKP